MHPTRTRRLALALLALCALAAVLLATVVAAGMQLTPATATGASIAALLLFAAIAFVHDALRAARWNAGYRLR
jgi:hypothetical protein